MSVPEFSPSVEAVAHRVNLDIALTLHEHVADPAVRDLAADMVRIGHELGEAKARLHAAFERISRPEPEPPLLKPGTVVRIPGIDVPYVVDKGLATSGPHATLTFTTVDGRDWAEDRTVNAAAEPGPRRQIHDGEQWQDVTEHVAGPLKLQTGETTEPYVSVNLSVTSDSSGEVLKVIKEALRNGSLTIPAKALA